MLAFSDFPKVFMRFPSLPSGRSSIAAGHLDSVLALAFSAFPLVSKKVCLTSRWRVTRAFAIGVWDSVLALAFLAFLRFSSVSLHFQVTAGRWDNVLALTFDVFSLVALRFSSLPGDKSQLLHFLWAKRNFPQFPVVFLI